VTELTHEEASSELAAVALDADNVEIADAVRAHASVCPECGPELAAMESAATLLAQLVPSTTMNPGRSAGIRSRLVMRARAERETRSAQSPAQPDITRGVASLTGQGHRLTPTSPQSAIPETREQKDVHPINRPGRSAARSPMMKWMAIAATLLFAASAAQLLRVTADRDGLREQLASRGADAVRADSLATALAETNAMIAAMGGRDVKVVSLTSESAQQPAAQMFWNRASHDWTMVAAGLSAPAPGRTYQLWLITDDAQISAGTFEPDAQGKTVLRANYALDRNALRAIAISEEPDGGATAPSGPIVIAGTAAP